jgi:aspartate kinase
MRAALECCSIRWPAAAFRLKPEATNYFGTCDCYHRLAMPIVVQKYGGSSVADVTRIQKVAERIMRTKAAGYDVAVVVSAMGDTTDELLALARKVSPNPDRRELDMLLSAGERISMAVLSMAIRELGGDAISFTGSQSGIITNDRHVDARIVEVRPYRVQDELARGRVVEIAGYQGVSYRREVTTLGRGGSDTTAVAMAAALGAEWCEICSDVDGVYTADPRVVPAAQRIGTLTYEETQELAEAGAKVLNAQAVEFAKEKGIAIYARATASTLPGNDPASDGTVVRRHAPRMPGTVAGVASERDLLVLQATDDWTRVVSVLDECGVSGKQLHVATFAGPADGTTLVISRENLHNEDWLRRALTAAFGDDARLIDGLGAVSIVGAGINATYQNVRRGVTCLQDNGIQSFGLATSSFRATWLIARDELDRAVRLLHALFLESSASASAFAR